MPHTDYTLVYSRLLVVVVGCFVFYKSSGGYELPGEEDKVLDNVIHTASSTMTSE
jgi:hypothetical protein